MVGVGKVRPSHWVSPSKRMCRIGLDVDVSCSVGGTCVWRRQGWVLVEAIIFKFIVFYLFIECMCLCTYVLTHMCLHLP